MNVCQPLFIRFTLSLDSLSNFSTSSTRLNSLWFLQFNSPFLMSNLYLILTLRIQRSYSLVPLTIQCYTLFHISHSSNKQLISYTQGIYCINSYSRITFKTYLYDLSFNRYIHTMVLLYRRTLYVQKFSRYTSTDSLDTPIYSIMSLLVYSILLDLSSVLGPFVVINSLT